MGTISKIQPWRGARRTLALLTFVSSLAPAAVLAQGTTEISTNATPATPVAEGAAVRPTAKVISTSAVPLPEAIASLRSDASFLIRERDGAPVIKTEMYVGEARTFFVPRLARIAVGSSDTLNVTSIEGREVLVFAHQVGISFLTVWDKAGRQATARITVLPANHDSVLRELATFLKSIPKATSTIVGDKVVVDGSDLSDADQQKIAILSQRYPQIVNFANRVGWEQMINLEVTVLELPQSEASQLGAEWSSQTLGGLSLGAASDFVSSRKLNAAPREDSAEPPLSTTYPSRGLHGYFGLNALLTSRINLLVTEGKASILARPRLTTRSGSSASFLSGGEIPYEAASATGTPSVQFKQYGVTLDITPVSDPRTRTIRSVIKTEVSDVDASLVTSSGPALLTRRTSSEFNVKEGETMVLSGFRRHAKSTDVRKVPGAGDVPLLGQLFRSTNTVDREMTLLIFVTPTIVEAGKEPVSSEVARALEVIDSSFDQPKRRQEELAQQKAQRSLELKEHLAKQRASLFDGNGP